MCHHLTKADRDPIVAYVQINKESSADNYIFASKQIKQLK